ncbi:DUF1028 domain-containing protein [Nesterenkonia populi]
MTFSLVAREPSTGAFGMVVTSSSPAVAARCIHLRSGVGAVASQNVTRPSLGAEILSSLSNGRSSREALAEQLDREAHPAYRQVSVVDADGSVAHHSGSASLGVNHSLAGHHAIAAGNLLQSPATVEALLAGYANSTAAAFEERLLDGLRAALEAGGESGPVRSAGIEVVEDVSWATTDLRVDDADDPVGELSKLWSLWAPQKEAYLTRALHPAEAPSYGVPGDE